MGRRRPTAARPRMATGARNRIPNVVETTPAMTIGGWRWWASARRPGPAISSTTPTAAKRRAGWGFGGRPERAETTDTRAAARAGHQAAATAVRTAMTMAIPMAHQ